MVVRRGNNGKLQVKHNGKLIEAYKLANFYKNVKYTPYNGEVLYNVLMENWETMKVQNLEVETLHPDNIIAKLYDTKLSESNKQDIIKEMNKAHRSNDFERLNLIKNCIL